MSASPESHLDALVAALPEPLAGHTANRLQQLDLDARLLRLEQPLAAELARLVACSEFAGRVLAREFDDLALATGLAAPDPAQLDELVETVANGDADIAAVKTHLRRFRNRYLLRLLAAEVAGSASLTDTLQGLSTLADRMLAAAGRYAVQQLEPRYGELRDASGDVVPLVILGMGKLGGEELNFSSDIDLVLLYPEEAESDGRRSLSAREYCTRLSQVIIALLDEDTADGFVFRVDTRLRPFGDSGPPVVSFAALESYLQQHGRAWERYAYVKARVVGEPPSPAVVATLYETIIKPFVYRRYLDFGVFESLRDMHAMISNEVKRRDLEDNVKLGPGGIREIEFMVQSLQLVRAGSQTELQGRELLVILPRLVGRRGLSREAAERLRAAYVFLRRLENFIQAIDDRQTHDLPKTELDQARLVLAMRFPDWPQLVEALDRHRRAVTEVFESFAFGEAAASAPDNDEYARLLQESADVAAWSEVLGRHGFEAVDSIAAAIVAFVEGPARHIDQSARQRLRVFLPRLLAALSAVDDPETVLDRMLQITAAILRRSAYLALLNENPPVLQRLLDLCQSSSFITTEVTRFPVLLDELFDTSGFTPGHTRAELSQALGSRLTPADVDDAEDTLTAIGRFQRAALFRIAIADVSDDLPLMKVSDALSELAETVIDATLAIAWRETTDRFGRPCFRVDGETREATIGVIAYGKLGGLELSYGSDLDLVFLHDSTGEEQQTDGESPLDNQMFFVRLVRRLVHLLSIQTGSGKLYDVDMRLRPEGNSGLLVTSTEAFDRYQRENAWTWEHQALLRARPVTGGAVAEAFAEIRQRTLTSGVRHADLRSDVVRMRGKMRASLDRSTRDRFDIKNGAGGIGDIEFLVQYLVLANAHDNPAVLEYTDNIRQLESLVTAKVISVPQSEQLQDAYRSLRRYQHRLRLDGRDALVAPAEVAAVASVVTRLWQQHLGAPPA